MDDEDDNPEHELATHYNQLYIKLIDRCKKYMQRLYSGYHFKDRCIDKRIGHISLVLSYIDYTDLNNSVTGDKDDVDDLNMTLNDLKDNIKEDLKDYIGTNLKLEINNEINLEIKNDIKEELKNEIEGEL